QERYCPELGNEASPVDSSRASKPKSVKTDPELATIVNAPLDFELKGLDATHPYLLGRGFTPETIQRFGIGYCSRGLLRTRIAIPLHDAGGTLVGYGGRVVDDTTISEGNP